MALMFLRSRSRIKASMVLTRLDHLCIHNYIRSLLSIMLRPILMVRTRLELASPAVCMSDALAIQLYVYVYMYTYRWIGLCNQQKNDFPAYSKKQVYVLKYIDYIM